MTPDVLDRRFHGVAVYNPDLLSKEELVAQFVARQQLLDALLADLRRPRFLQHQLLVGHRGMGKTTLLRRLRFAVDDDPALSAVWMPLTFPEEQYNVARLSDFYLNLIDALGETLEQRGRREEAAALDEAVEQIPQGDETRRAEATLAILLGAADRMDRRLLLLVDNLDLVLSRLEKQGSAQWSFRELLSQERRILLIGATPVFIGGTYDYEAPFYDFFRVHELHGLTREETRAVLSRLAVQRGALDVERIVREDVARIDTLHTLTVGNPRTIVLLFNILAQGTEGDARTDLEKLLDQCTPLYKARFDALAPQQQQVVGAVALHWDPITAGDLAEKLGLEVNTVSAQLARLVQQGFLEKVDYHPSAKTGFQVGERFFNIWYLMRAGRRVRQRLSWLVEFLHHFYGTDSSQTKAGALFESTQRFGKQRVREMELSLAVAQIIRDDWSVRKALGLDSQRETWHETARTDVSAGRMPEALNAFERAVALQQNDGVLLDYARALLVSGRPGEALAAIRSIVIRDARALAVEVGALMGLSRYAEATEASRAAAGKDFDLGSGLIVAAASLVLGLTEHAVEILRRTLAGHRAELQKYMTPGLLDVLGLAVASGHAILVRNLLEELGVHDVLRPAYEALDIAGVGDHDRIKRLAPELQEPVALLLDRWGVVLPEKKEKRKRKSRSRQA